jgi:DNA polymerase-1
VERELGEFPYPSLAHLPLADAVRYSARDADVTLRLRHKLGPELARRELIRTMEYGMSVLPVFEEMQSNGMMASRELFEELTEEVDQAMSRIQAKVSREFFGGRPFNPASSKHVATLLRRRGLRGEKKTSTGAMSTGKKSIEHLRFVDPAVELVMDWRENQKIRDAFCLPMLERAREEESTEGDDLFPVRCQIKTTRVATRRLSAANPNLLQIPSRTALGRRVRDCFVAPEGEVYGAWDLSQIEMRFMAHESRDPLLMELFTQGRCVECGRVYADRSITLCKCGGKVKDRDVHAETAAAVFKIPLSEVDKDKHRRPAKSAGFGILYGISGAGLYDQLRMMSETGSEDWSVDKCEALISSWLNVYGGVKEYIARTSRELKRDGVVRDCWGMPRYLPGIWSPDRKIAAEAGRMAVSHKIQGGAQGWIQNSINVLKPEVWGWRDSGLEVRWCLQIHDEIILRFEEGLWEIVDPVVRKAMTEMGGMELRVPVEAEGHCARSWGKVK